MFCSITRHCAPSNNSQIFAINLVTSMFGIVYFNGKLPSYADTAIKVGTSAGTVVGQLGFGYLADVVGRKKMYGLELIIIIFATLAQSLTSQSVAVSFVGLMVFWRIIMGVGIGGDYPLSSVITSEFATTKWRGAMMGAVFSMQGFGQLAAAMLTLIVTAGFRGSLESAATHETCTGVCLLAVDKMWRIIIGFGAVPGCIALYYRLTIPETPRYTFDVERDVEQADEDTAAYLHGKPSGHPDEMMRLQSMNAPQKIEIPKASWKDFCGHYGQWKYGKILLGTAGSWFLLDVAYYGLSLNNSIILTAIGYTGGATVYETYYKTAVGNLILVCAGALPGYWASVALLDIWGRKPIQIMGFSMLTALFIVIGCAYNKLPTGGLLTLYVLAQFFFNFGPNTTTFIVPGEVFPTRYRSTSHGISAASGKVGAIIAQVVFGPLKSIGAKPGATGKDATPWIDHIMQIFAGVMFLGLLCSFLIPETKRKTLEELAGEIPGTVNYDPHSAGHAVGQYDAEGNEVKHTNASTPEPETRIIDEKN